MNTKAVRLYGKMDLRLEEFELPEIKDDEILAHVILSKSHIFVLIEMSACGAFLKRALLIWPSYFC